MKKSLIWILGSFTIERATLSTSPVTFRRKFTRRLRGLEPKAIEDCRSLEEHRFRVQSQIARVKPPWIVVLSGRRFPCSLPVQDTPFFPG
jgi:hypothetical protein